MAAPPDRPAPLQLAFGFAPGVSLARADFIAAACNAEALAWIDRPDTWPSGRLVLAGPPGSGRTHLAAIFAAGHGAARLAGPQLAVATVPALLGGGAHAVIEAAAAAPEQALLHLVNLAAERGGRVLLTADRPAAAWGTRLADLASRLAASGAARLGIPDAGLLRAVLAKTAADRQLALPPALLDWLARRLPRDLAAAARSIALLDAASLAAGRAPDLGLARLALAASGEIPMTAAADDSRTGRTLL